MLTGTVFQWMISAQSLELKKHSLVWGLEGVYLSFLLLEVSDTLNLSSACCADLHQV
jgi:hypothetical protein